VKSTSGNYVTNRVLKLNVGFLLADGPGNSHEMAFNLPAIRLSDDLILGYIKGVLRLSRTKEGILVQGQLAVELDDECCRCLDAVSAEITFDLEELFMHPPSFETEFSIHDDGILDLAPLIRSETLIIQSRGIYCRPDCKGLCAECGENLNHTTCSCEADDIDPRMAPLKQLLDSMNS